MGSTISWICGNHEVGHMPGNPGYPECKANSFEYIITAIWGLCSHDDGTTDVNVGDGGGSTQGGGGTSTPTEPDYDGSDPNIHGNQNVSTLPTFDDEITEDEDPCENLKNLSKVDKYNIDSIITSLKQKVIDKNTKEWGTEFIRESYYDNTNNENVVNYTTNFREGNNYDITLSTGEKYNAAGHLIKYLGGIHSHPINGYSMFSWGDLRALLLMYDNISESFKPEISLLLVCYNYDDPPNPHVYAICVENIDALRNKIDALWNHQDYIGITDENKKVKSINDDTSEQYEANKNNLERFFLQNYNDYGISLYKAEDNMSNWNKKSLGSGTGSSQIINNTPCTL